jgi:LysR family nitrogen assimilation transcriptional regulator
MNLRSLHYFVAIADLGSFSAASRLLHVAQPALSRQIRNLENDLGVSLFQRTARGLLLSDSGRQLMTDGRRILELVEEATQRVRENAPDARERVSVAITPSISMILTAPLLTNVEHHKPSISLSIIESMTGNGSEWLSWIHERHLNIAVMYDVERMSELRSETIAFEELCLVGKFGRRRAKTPISFRSLAKYPLVLPTRKHPLRQIVDRAAREAGVTILIAAECNSILEVKWRVVSGEAYSILSPSAVWEEQRRKQMFVAPIVKPTLRRKVNILSLPAPLRSAAVRSVTDEIKATVHQLIESKMWNASQA